MSGSSSSSGKMSAHGAPKDARADPEAIAREVLRLGELAEYEVLLRLLGDPVGPGKPAVARKAFLRISMLIHPDKLPQFRDATKAFQLLVEAFERHQVGAAAPASKAKPGRAALSRSNDGCFRTEVMCPRCAAPWGKSVEGNPDYFYNFMMQGLRRFTCATCLLSFGCLTARHKCPYCSYSFEYSPELYHQKIKCGNPGCEKKFGFMMYHASNNAIKTAMDQALAMLEEQSRLDESKRSRAARAARRGGEDKGKLAETAFALGLRDVCPRCGLELATVEEGAQLRHLRECNDSAAHKKHQKAVQKQEAEDKAAADKESAQHSAIGSATWSFLGGAAEQLWMLEEEHLKKLCKEEGLSAAGGRVALISRLAEVLATRRSLPGPASLPKDLHRLGDEQLAAVCAAHRLKGPRSREARLDALEDLRLGITEAPALPAPKALAITDGKGHTAAAKAAGKAKASTKSTALVKAKAKAKAKAKTKSKAKAKAENVSPVQSTGSPAKRRRAST